MKDPLQIEKTPYERLEISEDATNETIKASFKKALMGKNSPYAVQAHQKLNSEKERALLDIFLYCNIGIKKIKSPVINIEQLDGKRFETAGEWLTLQKEEFPRNGAVAHCLAVLWYWTADYMENTGNHTKTDLSFKFQLPNTLTLEKAWQKALAWWAIVLQSDYIPEEWAQNRFYLNGNQDLLINLTQNTDSFITNKLENLYLKYCGNNSEKEGIYQRLKIEWENEKKAIQRFQGLKINVNGNKVNKGYIMAGKLALTELGMLEQIRQILTGYNYEGKDKDSANKLLANLSSIKVEGEVLLENEKVKEFIEFYNEKIKVSDNKEYVINELAEKIYNKAQRKSSTEPDLAKELFKIILNYKDASQQLSNLNQQNNKSEAKKFNQEGINLLEEARVLNDNGKLEEGYKKSKESEACFEEAARLDPNNSIFKKNVIEAKKEIAFSLNGIGIKKYNEGEELLKLGKYNEALRKANEAYDKFCEACELDPENETYRKNREFIEEILNMPGGNIPGGNFPNTFDSLNPIDRAIKINNDGLDLLKRAREDYKKYKDINAYYNGVRNAKLKFEEAYRIDPHDVYKGNIKVAEDELKIIDKIRKVVNKPYNKPKSKEMSDTGKFLLMILGYIIIGGGIVYGISVYNLWYGKVISGVLMGSFSQMARYSNVFDPSDTQSIGVVTNSILMSFISIASAIISIWGIVQGLSLL